MSASTAIGMVSASLRNLLAAEMRLTPAMEVTILAPDEAGGNRRINLFLYRIEENPFLRNQDPTPRPDAPDQLLPPPLPVNLFFQLTPYAPNDSLTGNATAHQILGEAMRVFYENPVVPHDHLDAGLQNAREQLRITPGVLDPEELSRIWTTFAQPFRLSVLYQVSTVQLDMRPERQQPVPKRVRTVGVPGVKQPLSPPAVLKLTPSSGQAGTSAIFSGEHLAGWRADVLVGGQVVLQGQPLTGDTFAVVIPAGLPPGLYEVQVDISRLFHRGFLFEVTL
jgi:hypothetical protein